MHLGEDEKNAESLLHLILEVTVFAAVDFSC